MSIWKGEPISNNKHEKKNVYVVDAEYKRQYHREWRKKRLPSVFR